MIRSTEGNFGGAAIFGNRPFEVFAAYGQKTRSYENIKKATEVAQRRGVVDRVSTFSPGIVALKEMQQAGLRFLEDQLD